VIVQFPRFVQHLLTAFACISSSAVAFAEIESSLSNEHGRITFDSGTGALREWHDVKTRLPILESAETANIWTIRFGDPSLPELEPANAKHFSWTHEGEASQESPKVLVLRWSDFGDAAAPLLTVEVRVAPHSEDATTRWNLHVTGLGSRKPSRVVFPSFHRIPVREGESLAVPVWMGERTTRFRSILNGTDGKAHRREWEYPGILSMQCIAISQPEGPGFYLAVDDTTALRKIVGVFGDGAGNAGVEISHIVESFDEVNGTFELPYNVIAGPNHGDWFDAASRFRAWALEQAWTKSARLRTGQTPDWVNTTGIWVWNRGRSENVLPPAIALQEHADLPVSVFWHWWHGCSYDTGFPEYLPPREGAESFTRAMENAHRHDIHAMVYMNQRLWSMETESWKSRGAAAFAVKDAAGNIRPEVYNTFTKAPNASMCIGTSFWRDTYAEIASTAFNTLGVDAIYMDQACSSLACYDSSHGHPLGGGRFWMDGFKKLSGAIRDQCTARGGIALAGEGCGEAWLPYLDVMLSLQVSMERYANPGEWEPIPFFHAVYHGYATFFGNYASLTMPPYDELWPKESAPNEQLVLLDKKYARQFRMEHTRSFVWGQQPTVANFRPSHLESRGEEMEFVLRLARLRQRTLPYLQHGTMLTSPTFKSPKASLDMSRLSIYAGQQGALREYEREYPVVLATAWRAPDSTVGLAVANIDDEPHSIIFSIPLNEWRVVRRGTLERNDELGLTNTEYDLRQTGELTLELPAKYAGVLVFPTLEKP